MFSFIGKNIVVAGVLSLSLTAGAALRGDHSSRQLDAFEGDCQDALQSLRRGGEKATRNDHYRFYWCLPEYKPKDNYKATAYGAGELLYEDDEMRVHRNGEEFRLTTLTHSVRGDVSCFSERFTHTREVYTARPLPYKVILKGRAADDVINPDPIFDTLRRLVKNGTLLSDCPGADRFWVEIYLDGIDIRMRTFSEEFGVNVLQPYVVDNEEWPKPVHIPRNQSSSTPFYVVDETGTWIEAVVSHGFANAIVLVPENIPSNAKAFDGYSKLSEEELRTSFRKSFGGDPYKRLWIDFSKGGGSVLGYVKAWRKDKEKSIANAKREMGNTPMDFEQAIVALARILNEFVSYNGGSSESAASDCQHRFFNGNCASAGDIAVEDAAILDLY